MKKSILLSLMVIGAIAAFMAAATSASFTDQVTSTSNNFTAGTLYMSVDGACGERPAGSGGAGGGAPCASSAVWNVGPMKPGDAPSNHTFTVVNKGNLSGTLSVTPTISYPPTCGAANWAITNGPLTSTSLASNASAGYPVSVQLLSSAGNTCQGAQLSITYQFDLVQ